MKSGIKNCGIHMTGRRASRDTPTGAPAGVGGSRGRQALLGRAVHPHAPALCTHSKHKAGETPAMNKAPHDVNTRKLLADTSSLQVSGGGGGGASVLGAAPTRSAARPRDSRHSKQDVTLLRTKCLFNALPAASRPPLPPDTG